MTSPFFLPDDRLPRCVYRSRARWKGNPIFFAIDSRGDVLHAVVLKPGGRASAAVAWLEALLDERDPVRPKLQLVRDGEPLRTRTREVRLGDYEAPDPNLMPNGNYSSGEIVEDRISYTLRRARQMAHAKPWYRLRDEAS